MTDTTPTVDRLHALQKSSLVQIAPGIYKPAAGATAENIPDIILARTARTIDGAVKLIPAGEQWVRITRSVVHALGFSGDASTLLRLGAAGFIEIIRVAPRCKLLNLSSWWGHLRRVAEDPDFWADDTTAGKSRHTAYCRVIAEVGRQYGAEPKKRKGKKRHGTV